MKTCEMNVANGDHQGGPAKGRFLKGMVYSFLVLLLLILSSNVTFAHCDTMDGPLIADAKKAMAQNNVNYALKWVPASDETAVRDAFDLAMKVRGLSPEAFELADKYFFDVLVHIHRAAEGVPFTGVKPSGFPVDEKILAADKSIEAGNLTPLEGMISRDIMPELTARFERVMSLKNYEVNNVQAGRAYIEAYVQFFKLAEGEEGHAGEGIHSEGHGISESDH